MKSKKSRLQARLILHLPGDEKQPVRWSFRSPDGDEQGELATGENDERLTHLFATYPAHILVPASEFVFHQVTLPPNAGRQRLQLLPFMLEEQLATEVDGLHFAILHQRGEVCDVAVVDKRDMRQWISRCDRLGVRVLTMLPDVLALPRVDHGWSAVNVDDRWLFRREAHAGMVVESSWLPEFLAIWSPKVIESYSQPPALSPPCCEWRAHTPQNFLQLAAGGEPYDGADLRQGEFARVGTLRAGLRPWRPVMMLFTGYLLLSCVNAGLSHYQLGQQADHWRQESRRVYQALFPADKNVLNPRTQLQKHLQQLRPTGQDGLAVHMHQLQQLMAKHPQIELRSLSYDAGRKTLKIDLYAASFLVLEQFQSGAGQHYRVQPGEVKQNPHGVESRLTLEIKDEYI
ncbi:General secretion pathway protein L [Klebsiella michiganensis]|uniref:type II secretion system protein GspL n=1 Tax=Klebsiella michiganensis TaxID=1134687 RepID=UPI0007CCC617|nr:type II secretion system protein GspL [Klebsiella michiganensis]SBL56437.1 General secretion pathway protein L [Klebsiella michiganensis]